MGRYATSSWTEERIELVKRRWSQGVSARRIARELGDDVSRSAVLGKIHRLGVVDTSPNSGGRRSESKAAPLAAGPDATAKLPRNQCDVPAWASDAEPYIDDPLVDADIPVSQRRAFLELSGRACRWPVGNPGSADFFFCGAEAFVGKPYCAAHCARAYRPVEDPPPGRERPPASSRARMSRHPYLHPARRNHRRRPAEEEG